MMEVVYRVSNQSDTVQKLCLKQRNLETPKIAYSQNRKRTIPDTVETNEEVLEPTPTVGEPFSEAYPSHRTAQQEVHMDVQRPSKPLVDMSLTEQQESITATELPQDIAIEADVV